MTVLYVGMTVLYVGMAVFVIISVAILYATELDLVHENIFNS